MHTATSTCEKKQELLQHWHAGLRILQKGNFMASTYYGKCSKAFGVPVVIVTSIVGSAIFATIGNTSRTEIQILAGFASLLATVLSSLQTFLGFAERASAHKAAAVSYGELRTELQVLMSCQLTETGDLDEHIESIRTRWCALDKVSPTLPDRIVRKVSDPSAGNRKPDGRQRHHE